MSAPDRRHARDNEGPVLWERVERSAAAARAKLSHSAIAQAAVAMADADGLDNVTLRSLATRLGVAPMALYRYVNSKEDLFQLMVDAAHPEAPASPSRGNWRDALRTHAEQIRATMLRHPWLLHLPPRARMALTPRRFAALERALSSLDGLKLEPDAMMLAVETVAGFATGATASEILRWQLMETEGWKSGSALRAGLSREMSWLLGTGRHPKLEHYICSGQRKDDRDWMFQLGLECVLDGIAQRLGIRRRGRIGGRRAIDGSITP